MQDVMTKPAAIRVRTLALVPLVLAAIAIALTFALSGGDATPAQTRPSVSAGQEALQRFHEDSATPSGVSVDVLRRFHEDATTR